MKKLMMALCLIPLMGTAHAAEHEPKQCDGHKHHMKHKKAGDMPFYLRDIDLTETQQAQVKAMMEKRHADRKTGKGEYWQTKKAIHELTRAEDLNEVELEKLIDKSLAMKKEAALARARFHHEIYNLLTAEQQQQLEAKLEAWKQKHKQS